MTKDEKRVLEALRNDPEYLRQVSEAQDRLAEQGVEFPMDPEDEVDEEQDFEILFGKYQTTPDEDRHTLMLDYRITEDHWKWLTSGDKLGGLEYDEDRFDYDALILEIIALRNELDKAAEQLKCIEPGCKTFRSTSCKDHTR